MDKRQFLLQLSAALAASAAPLQARAREAGAAEPALRLAAAWREPAAGSGARAEGPDFVGVLQVDWAQRSLRVQAAIPVPTRAHGLLAEPDGSFLAVAARPGGWLLRADATAQVVQRIALADERPARSLNGHVSASADGRLLYTPETDPATGEGWVSVRDRATLAKLGEWRSHGQDPHQTTVDASGALLVVNGGIARSADGKKRNLVAMDPSLVRLDPHSGERLGQWRLPDPRLSLRHLAWSPAVDGGPPLLGIALQAEHEDAARRAEAPVLAVWNGQDLRLPTQAAGGEGYAGDIAAGPDGGFVLSGQRAHRALWWRPQRATELTVIGELQEVCALSAWSPAEGPGGVLIGAARGLARWHPTLAPMMLAWPRAMVPDNHWVLLG